MILGSTGLGGFCLKDLAAPWVLALKVASSPQVFPDVLQVDTWRGHLAHASPGPA